MSAIYTKFLDCGRLKSNSAVFPWNVGIYLGSENEAELVCLGSIIQSDAVLTGNN